MVDKPAHDSGSLAPLLGSVTGSCFIDSQGVIAGGSVEVAAFLYIAFYVVNHYIAGIGNGVVMQQFGASST